MKLAVVITGATGYIGKRVARDYLAAGARVIVCLRAADDDEFAQRSGQLQTELGGLPGHLELVRSDLTDAEPFAGIDPREVERIVHSAAVTRFNVERDLAETVNFLGSIKVFEFARKCPNLAHLGVLSTLYVAGLVEGAIDEGPLAPGREFANHYEWSKWKAEHALATEYADLPWSIMRLGTVISDGDSGTVTQQNAVHNTLKLFFYGLLSLLPGDADTPLHFVTGDFCADAVFSLMSRAGARQYYHVCYHAGDALSLQEFSNVAFERFEQEPDFRERKILRPLLCDRESFELLAEGIDSFGGAVVNQGLRSVRPFVRQMYSAKQFPNTRLLEHFPGYASPDVRRLLAAAVDTLVETRWGKRERATGKAGTP